MDMNYLTALRAALIATPLLFIGAAQAQPMLGDAYYQNNIDKAIREAKQNRRRFDYSNKHWYNRTTARSFDFDKLKNTEMAESTVPGALDATAAGPGDTAPTRQDPLALKTNQLTLVATTEKQKDDAKSDNADSDADAAEEDVTKKKGDALLVKTEVFKEELVYHSKYGSSSTKNIRSKSTIKTYVHP